MTPAELNSLLEYPVKRVLIPNDPYPADEIDLNGHKREGYIKGYRQALSKVKDAIEKYACQEHGAFIDRILDFIEEQEA